MICWFCHSLNHRLILTVLTDRDTVDGDYWLSVIIDKNDRDTVDGSDS